MPIVDPQGFDALGLFPLQINPHFTNALPTGHQGETREQRIRELLVVAPVNGDWFAGRKLDRVTDGRDARWPEPDAVVQSGEEAITLPAGHRF